MQAAAHGAFLQTLGLRFDSDGVRRFCLAPRFGAIAARLLQVPAVRIFHEQALFKQPVVKDMPWLAPKPFSRAVRGSRTI